MATITHRGNAIHTSGELPKTGSKAPGFKLVDKDLKDVGLDAFAGKKKLLNIYPSVDTPVCAMSTQKFNEHAAKDADCVMLMIASDLPFAFNRFCGDKGLANVRTLSLMRGGRFAEDYGVRIVDGVLAGICARAVVVLDRDDVVRYTELVPEIAQEPDYQKALAALQAIA
jgi:thiol peroxidase